jgi:hypothetical protein
MNTLFIVIYLVSFCLIAGGAFAMMYANIQSTWRKPSRPQPQRHPEAPKPGEEVLYVDLQRERLEDLFKD